MIIIFSNDSDQETSDVISWITYLTKGKQRYVRLNEGEKESFIDEITIEHGQFENIRIGITKRNFSLLDFGVVQACWVRKGGFRWMIKQQGLPAKVTLHLQNEWYTTQVYLHQQLERQLQEKNRILGSFFRLVINKLLMLSEANKVGLITPKTVITSKGERVLAFDKQVEESLVTKAIQRTFRARLGNYNFESYTKEVGKEEMQKSSSFFPSLFQEKIKKKYEIRSFFLKGEFYSMAIFSQASRHTNIDYRQANTSRCVPFQLPNKVQEKLKKLMNILELDTGSLDLILTPDGEYIFLEVNPVGQFSMVSYPCNYYLEAKVAAKLTSEEKSY